MFNSIPIAVFATVNFRETFYKHIAFKIHVNESSQEREN